MTNPCRLPVKPRLIAAALERTLGLHSLAAIYDARPAGLDPLPFLDYVLNALGISIAVANPQVLDDIPRQGPLLVVANHPLGGLEGMAIARLIGRIRPDLQVLTNELLRRIPELAPLFIGVDVLSRDGKARNTAGLRKVHRHLQQGGALQLFPAGMVSAYQHGPRRIQDRAWHRLAGKLLLQHRCVCAPIHVRGKNSAWFYAAGMIHPRLRTLLLPRQLANKRGSSLHLKPGRPIPARELLRLGSPVAVTQYLRVSTEALGQARDQQIVLTSPRRTEEIRSHGCGAASVGAIPNLQDCKLLAHAEFDVYCAPWERLGAIAGQIAIAREISFRAAGEGTGMNRDSDRFDPHYQHLFLWDKRRRCVAGAYRVGLVDEIVATEGIKGLYTRSLYQYKKSFISQLGSAIEMGRSFIHVDYQRRPVCLHLLWRGIGQLLIKMPRYHTLFGSVSISREYSDLARSLIADTLLTHYRAKELAPLVRPITPHRIDNRVWDEGMITELANVKVLGNLIGRCDPGKTLPVLLKHYLSLNGRLVCFNIHPGFNHSLEGLIVVDVRKTGLKTLRRFLGGEGAMHFLSCHRLRDCA